MEIIQVVLEIQIIPNKMVPESSLPDAAFAALGRRFLGWSVLSSQIAALAADGSLNDRPTGTEIIIIFRQRPDGMKVIRQQHPGLDGEGQGLPHLLNPLSQGGPDMVVNQEWSASKRDHGKEIAAAFYSDSAVFRHLSWCVRRTLLFPNKRLICNNSFPFATELIVDKPILPLFSRYRKCFPPAFDRSVAGAPALID